MLENEIVPMYYSGGEDGVPEQWVHRMKQCLMNISPEFNCQRMVNEYMEKMYRPAHSDWQQVKNSRFDRARERTKWSRAVNEAWGNVRFVELGEGPDAAVVSGSAIQITATVDLAGLKPSDVRVEAVVGRVGNTGQLEDSEVITLPPVSQNGAGWLYSTDFVPHQTGMLGYGLRVSPNNAENPLTRPCNSLLKWSGQ